MSENIDIDRYYIVIPNFNFRYAIYFFLKPLLLRPPTKTTVIVKMHNFFSLLLYILKFIFLTKF